EVHGGEGLDLLVAPQLSFDRLGDTRDRQSAREPLALAARDKQVSDLHLVARVDHLDLARIARRIPCPTYEPPRVRALVFHVPTAGGVDRELHVDRVAGDISHRSDHAIGRDDGHVLANVSRAAIEHDARDAKEFGDVFSGDLRAHGLAWGGLAELEEA